MSMNELTHLANMLLLGDGIKMWKKSVQAVVVDKITMLPMVAGGVSQLRPSRLA